MSPTGGLTTSGGDIDVNQRSAFMSKEARSRNTRLDVIQSADVSNIAELAGRVEMMSLKGGSIGGDGRRRL